MAEATTQTLAGQAGEAATASRVPPLPRRIPPRTVTAMLATAARAPSVHNTQPWRFAVGSHAIDLYADTDRKLGQDRDGREMLISCGAALFGLRLAVRGLGYLPAVTLFSEPSKPTFFTHSHARAVRSDREMPRNLKPKAMFSRTFRCGSSEYFWSTRPRSGPASM